MSAKRQVDIAEIDRQIAEIQLMKLGAQSPPQAADQEKFELDLLKAQKGLLTAEEAKEATYGKIATELQKEENDTPYTKAAKATRNAGLKVRLGAGSLNRWAANIPTPGTFWTPLVILLFLYLVLFAVNNHSRLGWFGLVLTGNAELPTATEIAKQSTPGTTQQTSLSTSQGGNTNSSGEQPATPQQPQAPVFVSTSLLNTNTSFLSFVGSSE